jgi:hypothetical protein
MFARTWVFLGVYYALASVATRLETKPSSRAVRYSESLTQDVVRYVTCDICKPEVTARVMIRESFVV